jgi:signal transduction histidine kinase
MVTLPNHDTVEPDVAGDRPPHMPDAVALAAYRIVQESLTNASRHAAGAPVHVRLAFEPSALTLAVRNGTGVGTNGHGETARVGIVGMTERAVAVGGTLRAASTERGFSVDAELPYAGIRG